MNAIIPGLSRPSGRHAQLRRVLAELGFEPTISFEDAAQRLKECIVYARKLGNDAMAARFSEAKVFLKSRLKHKCAGVDCANLVFPRSSVCVTCRREQLRGKRHAYHTYSGRNGVPPIVEAFVRGIDRPFFLDEVSWTVHLAKPKLSQVEVNKSAYSTLRRMRKRGMIVGGGGPNWRRYEKNLSAPEWAVGV